MTISQSTIDKLRTFDTATICNIIELFEVWPRTYGYVDNRIKCNFPELPPMVGFACTATIRTSSARNQDGAYSRIDQQLEMLSELPGPGVLVFQDLDEPLVAANFGELMCSTYQAFGAAGIVTTGAGRDLEQVRANRFPVFTSGTICSHGYCHLVQLGLPVRIGGLTVSHGDLLHGDLNGVTSIPPVLAAAVADIGDEFVEAEKILLDYLRTPGAKTVEQYREVCQELGAELRLLTECARRASYSGPEIVGTRFQE